MKRNATLRRALAVFFLLAVLIGGSIFFFARSNNPGPRPTPNPGDVHMGETNFVPQSVTISEGSSINLINGTNAEHIIENGTWENSTPTLGTEAGAPQGPLEFKVVGQSKPLGPFTTAGTFHYICTVHPGMTLTVTVTGQNADNVRYEATDTRASREVTQTLQPGTVCETGFREPLASLREVL